MSSPLTRVRDAASSRESRCPARTRWARLAISGCNGASKVSKFQLLQHRVIDRAHRAKLHATIRRLPAEHRDGAAATTEDVQSLAPADAAGGRYLIITIADAVAGHRGANRHELGNEKHHCGHHHHANCECFTIHDKPQSYC